MAEVGPSWSQRLRETKVTPVVFLAFFAMLAIMSGAAALVGYTVHRLSHPPAQSGQP